ncbi:hypothetical protein B7463_g12442, partial [Scytalidium lignicola]
MAQDESLTDEYVAGLLVKDAKESSIKYSAMGLEGFASSKPPPNKLKPNTRFLRSIIQETDNHNTALLAKEAADSRARLASLSGKAPSDRRTPRVRDGDIRKRQMGDITAILAGGVNKRRKVDISKPRNVGSRSENISSEDEGSTRKEDKERRRTQMSEDDEERSSRSRHRSSRKHRRSVSNDRRRHDDRERLSRSRSPKERRGKESRHRHRSPRRRSQSREREYSQSPLHGHKSTHLRSNSRDRSTREKSHRLHHRHRSPDERKAPGKETQKASNEPSRLEEDSDPLDDIIGPKPPPIPKVNKKGRGIASLDSGIDSRFSSNYDPTVDVQLDLDEEDDWDQALEALRDRQKWKQQGADRLRSAGFTEDEIRKWEKGGEKNEEDVQWTRRGEAREWDRGKILDNDGQVVLQADFGRLKGT